MSYTHSLLIESFPEGTCRIRSTTAGSHLQPGAIFCPPRQQVKQCPWITLLTAHGKSFSAQASDCKALGTQTPIQPFFSLSSSHLQHSEQSHCSPVSWAQKGWKFSHEQCEESSGKVQFFDNTLKVRNEIYLWSAHLPQRKFQLCSWLPAACFIAEQPEVLLHHWGTSPAMRDALQWGPGTWLSSCWQSQL